MHLCVCWQLTAPGRGHQLDNVLSGPTSSTSTEVNLRRPGPYRNKSPGKSVNLIDQPPLRPISAVVTPRYLLGPSLLDADRHIHARDGVMYRWVSGSHQRVRVRACLPICVQAAMKGAGLTCSR